MWRVSTPPQSEMVTKISELHRPAFLKYLLHWIFFFFPSPQQLMAVVVPSSRSVYQQGGAPLCNWHTSASPPAFSHPAASLAGGVLHSPHAASLLVGHTSSSISNVAEVKFDPDSPPALFLCGAPPPPLPPNVFHMCLVRTLGRAGSTRLRVITS